MPDQYANLLIITHESVGEKMAGPSIRAWEIARGLGSHGVRVTLATPYPSERSANNVIISSYTWDNPEALAALIEKSDAVLATGPVLARVINVLSRPIDKPVIVDTYYVPEIEEVMLSLTGRNGGFDPTQAFISEMQLYLHQGDFFICALEKQYDFWMGGLLSAGRINPTNLAGTYNLDHLIGIVPMGIPDDAPQKIDHLIKGNVPGINANDRLIYWGGGIWDWTDPLCLMDALQIVVKERDDVRIMFGALNHYDQSIVPHMSMAGQLMARIEKENWLNHYVFFQDWIPYDRRGAYLLESDLGVSLNQKTLESRYAIRARLMDYLWAGLPSVLTEGDDIAALLRDIDLATLVQPRDVEAVAKGILSILAKPAGYRDTEMVGRQQAGLRWSETVKPLLPFLKQPHNAVDGAKSREALEHLLAAYQHTEKLREENRTLSDRILNLQQEISVLEQNMAIMRNRKVVRIADAYGHLRDKILKRNS